jgi:beta-lactamase regulating signal transducer with metallopeptidase domain
MEPLVQIGLSNAVVALLLAVVAALVGALARKPALTHTLWLLVLLKLVTPPLVRVPVGWSEPARTTPPFALLVKEAPENAALPEGGEPVVVMLSGEPGEVPAPVPGAAEEAAVEPVAEAGMGPGWWSMAGWVWLAGALVWFGLALWRVVAFHRLLRFGRPAPEWLCRQVAALGEKLGLKHMPPVLLVPGRIPPMIWTTPLGPRLLLPAGLWESLTVPRRETLLLHELAHLRRRDHWVRALELVVLGLYWWHPIVWIACRQLREAEEQCCDAWVVTTLAGSGRTYAEAILETLDFLAESRTPAPLLASGVGAVSDLKRRLTMILRGTTPRSLTWRGLVAVLLVAGLLLPALPVWAQQPTDKDAAAALKELREKLAELEKKLGQPNPAPKVDAEELKKAEKELADAQAALKQKAAEMEAAAKKVAEAQAKVVKAGGKAGGDGVILFRKLEGAGGADRVIREGGWQVIPADTIRGLRIEKLPPQPGQPVPVPPGQFVPRVIEVPALPGQPGGRIQIEMRPEPNRPVAPPAAAPGGDRRIENLEQKLDNLIKQLEDLRRSLPKPGAPGGGGVRPGGLSIGPGGAVEIDLERVLVPATPAPGTPVPVRP